jgi:hypothetical protein
MKLQLTRIRLFVGDGESNEQGAAEGLPWDRVRTRANLASLINMPSNIKKELEEEGGCTYMETGEDDDIVYLRSFRDAQDEDETGDVDDERANALLDEDEDEEEVVSVVGEEEEEEEDDGEEGGASEAVKTSKKAAQENSGPVEPEAARSGIEQSDKGSGMKKSEKEDDVSGRDKSKKEDEITKTGGKSEEEEDVDAPVEVDTAEADVVKHPDAMYKPVQSIRAGCQNPMKLNPRMKYNRGESTGFLIAGDERVLRNSNMCSMELKRNTSASFNPVTGKCNTCLNGTHEAWSSRSGGPIALSLSDQHFPPNIPADDAGECIRVLRVEDGSVTELADELLRIVPPGGLPGGSIILFGSLSQLAVDSVEKYAADWARNRNWIKDRMGEVIIVPFLPLSAMGVEDRVVVRSLIDLAAWYDTLQEAELRLLRNTRKGWEDAYLGKKSRGAGWADYRLNMSLPASLYQGAGTMPFTTGSWGDRPTGIVALSEAGERYWIGKMVCELNREVGLGLATAWSVGRTMSAVRRQVESVEIGRIVTIGASNAASTAAALGKRGIRHLSLVWPGRTITKDTVEMVMQEARTAREPGDIMLVQWLENSIFFILNEETGCMDLPTRDEDEGIFHIKGKVTVSKDVQLQMLLSKLEPLLGEDPEQLKVFVCPLVRFLEDCCEEHSRSEDTKREDAARQLKELYHLRRAVKAWLITRKLKNVLLVDPLSCLGASKDIEKARAILKDGFHLKACHMATVADKIKEVVASWVRGRKRAGGALAGAEAKKARIEVPAAGRLGEKSRPGKAGKAVGPKFGQ